MTVAAVLSLFFLAEKTLTPQQISQKLDDLYRAESSFALVSMRVKTKHYTRNLKMKIWTQGKDKTRVLILSPRKEKGMGTLKQGKKIWNYFPKIDKTILVAPSMMSESWMGSDFSNNDLVREIRWDSDYHIKPVEASEKDALCLQFTPKDDVPITWKRVVSCFHEVSYLPLYQDFYDEKDILSRKMEFLQVKDLGGKKLPSVMKLSSFSREKKGNTTTLTYEKLEFNPEIKKSTFSKTALKRGK